MPCDSVRIEWLYHDETLMKNSLSLWYSVVVLVHAPATPTIDKPSIFQFEKRNFRNLDYYLPLAFLSGDQIYLRNLPLDLCRVPFYCPILVTLWIVYSRTLLIVRVDIWQLSFLN